MLKPIIPKKKDPKSSTQSHAKIGIPIKLKRLEIILRLSGFAPKIAAHFWANTKYNGEC